MAVIRVIIVNRTWSLLSSKEQEQSATGVVPCFETRYTIIPAYKLVNVLTFRASSSLLSQGWFEWNNSVGLGHVC